VIAVREAEDDDLEACAALQEIYTTSAAYQVTLEGDPGSSEGTATAGPLFRFSVQQVRLPRKRVLQLPSTLTPLAHVWDDYDLRLVAVQDEVVQDEAVLCGYALLQIVPDQHQALFSRLLVDPDARNHGAGTALLRTARSWARAQGLRALLLSVPLRNVPGAAFCLRRGFRICGLSEFFYPTREGALLLRQEV
jgi:GNAT superfamily N-acetyltransferase